MRPVLLLLDDGRDRKFSDWFVVSRDMFLRQSPMSGCSLNRMFDNQKQFYLGYQISSLFVLFITCISLF